MPDIFLSYSRDDQATARRFAEALERAGFNVWWDQTLRSGEAYDQVTEKALKDARAVVVLWSKKSVDSRWVRTEATIAHRNQTLVPVMIEACERPIMFELTQTADLSGWNGDASDRTWLVFASDVRRYMNSVEAPAAAAAPVLPAGAPRRSGIVIAVTVTALLVVAGTALWWLASRHGTQSAVQGATPGAAQDTATVTLAVLPFADISAAHDQEYFAEGLAEELLNQLGQVKRLRVTARNSSFVFKGRNEDMRLVGQKLGVDNLLEGGVRKDGNRLAITVRLISSRDGNLLWSQTYNRELSSVFEVQDEVSKDVAKALSITLDVGDLPRIQGGTTNIEAYDRYLQARKLSQLNGAAEFRQASELLRTAVRLDPQFSRAWLALVGALSQSLRIAPANIDESGTTPEELAAATGKVLELTPNSWEAQLLRGVQFTSQHQWAQADAAFAAMTAAGAPMSGNDEVTIGRGRFLRAVGRIREAVQFYERAVREDPLSLYASVDLQTWLDAVGRSTEAQAEYERSKGLVGNHSEADAFAILRVLARKDADPAAIKAQIGTVLSSNTLGSAKISRTVAASLHNPEQVREVLRKVLDDPANQNAIGMTTVSAYAARFDDKDTALVALRRAAVDFRFVDRLWLPLTINLRAEPRFKEIVRATGLVDFWRSSGKWGDVCKPVGADDFECH